MRRDLSVSDLARELCDRALVIVQLKLQAVQLAEAATFALAPFAAAR
jgi:hypothetical protein